MIDYVKTILIGQFEAALCMMDQCIRACPPEHAFVLRDFHQRGGDDRDNGVSPGLTPEETLAYVQICRQKLLESIAAETSESLQGPSGFAYREFTRGELYIYNLRHVQHHIGQLSAFLRRVDPALSHSPELDWIGSGWK